MVKSEIAYTRADMPDGNLESRGMLSSNRDAGHVNVDYIPFTQIANSSPNEMSSANEQISKGNGADDQTLFSRYRHSRLAHSSNTLWTRILLCVCAVLLILLAVFFFLWFNERNNRLENDESCLDYSCIVTSSDVLRNMDESIEPCDNFYEYACNGWINNHPIPYGQNQWSVFKTMSQDVDYFSKKLLENTTYPNISRGLALARTHYKSCMNTSEIDRRGLEPLYDQIEQLFGGWILIPVGSRGARKDGQNSSDLSGFNLTDIFRKLLEISNTTPLFSLGVGRNARNSSEYLNVVTEGTTTLVKEAYSNEKGEFTESTREYKYFMKNYSKLLGVPTDKLGELDKVYEFETLLTKNMLRRDDRDPEIHYKLGDWAELERDCPVVQWLSLINQIYAPMNYTVRLQDKVAFPEKLMFRRRCKVFSEYLNSSEGIQTIHNTIIWQSIWRTWQFMPKNIRQLIQNYRKVSEGLDIEPARWTYCQSQTQEFFGFTLSRYFVDEHFKEESKRDAEYMISEIKESFKENLFNLHWMKEEDRHKAIEKVNTMPSSIGYPEKVHNLTTEEEAFEQIQSLDPAAFLENTLINLKAKCRNDLKQLIVQEKSIWELAPNIVNAFYEEDGNHIYFPAGILQYPFYSPKFPKSLNYGGIGVVVGHEITHAFDQVGSKRDAKGNLAHWWSNETVEGFRNFSQCMIDQYDNYVVYNLSVNGKMTLGENIADNLGLRASYKTFIKEIKSSGNRPKLPGIDQTAEQLFFTAFAQLWCANNSPQSAITSVITDYHTIEKYRVIGTLQNSEEFSRAFNCPVGSYMNPVKKCMDS